MTTLSQQKWHKVSFHEVVLEWIRSERHRDIAKISWPKHPAIIERLIDQPDLMSADENRARLRLFYLIRWPLFVELPPDTAWYRVSNLTADLLSELRAINSWEWTDPEDQNELHKVAERKRVRLEKAPNTWAAPILFSTSRQGPFTILEGNNRLVALASSEKVELNLPVFIGISPLGSCWEPTPRRKRRYLMRDLVDKLSQSDNHSRQRSMQPS